MFSFISEFYRLTIDFDWISELCHLQQMMLLGVGIAKQLGLGRDKSDPVHVTVCLCESDKKTKAVQVIAGKKHIISLAYGRNHTAAKVNPKA